MRVLHIQKVKGIGGSERHLLSLLPLLKRAGLDVRMCVLAEGDFTRFTKAAEELEVEVSTLPAGTDLNPLLIGSLAREIKSFRPDLVHTHLIHADLYGQVAARIAGVPSLSSFHNTQAFYRQSTYNRVARISARLERHIIAISHHVAQFIEELGIAQRDKVSVVHYGIDPGQWQPSSSARHTTRGSLGLGPDEIVVAITSRLVPKKGHDVLLSAFDRAFRERPGLRLLIAGDGPLKGALQARAGTLRSSNAIRFLGYVDDVSAVMGASDIVALPSVSEGFGLAALEGMAAGRPVIAGGVDSLPEIVVHEETGLLVRPEDASAIAGALCALCDDEQLRTEMGRKGMARAAEEFSLGKMIDRTLAVYRGIV